MKLAKLEEVTDINPTKPRHLRNSDERVSFLGMGNVTETGTYKPNEATATDVYSGYTYFQQGDVLLAKITPCMENGKATLVHALETDHAFGSTEFHVMRPIEGEIDGRYLFFMIWNPYFRAIAEMKMTGSAGQKRVPTSFLKNFKVPLPPLAEQRRIADILDRADALRRKQREAIQLTESLLRSTFLEMFGDPVTNPKGWETIPLGECGVLDRGRSRHRPRNAPELLGGPYPLVQTSEVANCTGVIESYTQTYSELGLSQSKMWPTGTLCITIAANIAKTGVLGFDSCFPDSIVGFSPNSSITISFIQAWFSFLQPLIEARAPQVAQRNINLKILRNLEVALPPYALQLEYERLAKLARYTTVQQNRQFEESSTLFHALSQRAFKGQL